MISFEATIQKFGNMGEKTGWIYIAVPVDIAVQIKPNAANREHLDHLDHLDRTINVTYP